MPNHKPKRTKKILDKLEPLACVDNTGAIYSVVTAAEFRRAKRARKRTCLYVVGLTAEETRDALASLLGAALEGGDAARFELRGKR